MLSFAAGMVNVCGVLHIGVLTTNVTGHFAFFAEQLVEGYFRGAFLFLIYIGAFLAGAFISSIIIELVSLSKPQYSHVAPMFLEAGLLFFVSSGTLSPSSGSLLACILLFSMGIQNSLVSRVSSFVVRTTHLTGLFTDLGIELSQLLFYREKTDRQKLKSSLILRSAIILSFFAGCVIGGLVYLQKGIHTLAYTALLLLCALLYDNVRYRVYSFRRKIASKSSEN